MTKSVDTENVSVHVTDWTADSILDIYLYWHFGYPQYNMHLYFPTFTSQICFNINSHLVCSQTALWKEVYEYFKEVWMKTNFGSKISMEKDNISVVKMICLLCVLITVGYV